jgi:mRNA interferase YafQ
MRTIRFTARFRKDYKREKAGRHGRQLDDELREVLAALQQDHPLPRHRFDHPLKGEWSDCRDCHVRPDLVLIYRKPDAETLELVRLGSHAELGF